jgi:hypothetical protein
MPKAKDMPKLTDPSKSTDTPKVTDPPKTTEKAKGESSRAPAPLPPVRGAGYNGSASPY